MQKNRQTPKIANYVKKSPKIPQKPFRPKRLKNAVLRKREYLSENEIKQIQKSATQKSRHPLRDEAIILIMFRHGLRVSELVSLRWDQIVILPPFFRHIEEKHSAVEKNNYFQIH